MTDRPVGKINEQVEYEENTVFRKVAAKLEKYVRLSEQQEERGQ